MEESQNLMWLKRKQILKSNIQVPFGVSYSNNNSWEERAFAEDAARILGGCIWPPRSYSCNFCKREFRSAQALGGHMNVHRRDRARLKQSLGQLNHQAPLHFHHKHDFTSSGTSPSWPSTISTKENSFHSSSISWGNHKECLDSEEKGIVVNNAREQLFKGYNDYVETSLSVGQNLSTGDSDTSYKRPKTSSICYGDRLKSFQSAEFVLGLKPGMEDMDLELRLGKTQKV